jgi:hypothetical protein
MRKLANLLLVDQSIQLKLSISESSVVNLGHRIIGDVNTQEMFTDHWHRMRWGVIFKKIVAQRCLHPHAICATSYLTLLGLLSNWSWSFSLVTIHSVLDGSGSNFDDEGGYGRARRPIRKERDDKVHDSIIEERIQRERPCRTLFIRNIKASLSFSIFEGDHESPCS